MRAAARLDPARHAAVTRYLPDADQRPLADAFLAELHVRLATSACHVAAIARAAARPEHARALAVMLELLRKDELAGERFAAELRAAWAHVGAALGDSRAQPTDAALWSAWARRLRREPPPGPAIVVIA
jgi:hypothetical protein